jgi:glyoxylase-like metal-dependent hydrolase (beta-lactamase superfamily II)
VTRPPVSVRIGDVEVISLDDGRYAVDMTELAGIDRERALQLTCECGLDCGSLPVNAFVLRMPFGNVLVDAGAGVGAAPHLGRMASALVAARIDVQSISHVLLTHLHPDHCAGLVTIHADALFPRAKILVHANEAAFWLDGDIDITLPARTQRNAAIARAALAPYRDRISRVTSGSTLPGIEVIALPGHTPGHAGWLLRSAGESMLFWGDVVHFAAVQIANPDVTVRFDVDDIAAADTRRQLLALVAASGMAVAGAHLPYPGFGYIEYDQNAYRFTSGFPCDRSQT